MRVIALRCCRGATHAVLLTACTLPAAAADYAASPGARWYASARSGIVITDQNFRRDGAFGALTIGRELGPEYALEIELFAETLDFGIDYGLRNQGISINHRTINREPLWDPYFLIGAGVMRFEAPVGQAIRTGSHFLMQVGVGGEWELVVPDRVLLRADVRMRLTDDQTGQPGQEGFGDGVVSVGLTVPF